MKRRFLVAGALALVAMASQAGTAAATPAFSLRVEAPGATLDPGTLYAPRSPIGSLRGETPGGSNCVRGGGQIPLAGRTALGLAASAANANKGLQPLWVVEDAFGRRICRIGGFTEADSPSFTGWLYRVNHVAPAFTADDAAIKKGDEVLWVFADFGSGVNTGDELVLTAPVRATPGTVEVTVSAVSFDGNVNPAPDGSVVSGGTAPATTTGGKALVAVGVGNTSLRAVGPGAAPLEIPSNQAPLCVAARLEDCPPQPGLRLIGTNLRDSFKGGAGPDLIRTRGGPDKVRVRGGGSDVVDCGKGRDAVIADATDKLRRCEKVRGR